MSHQLSGIVLLVSEDDDLVRSVRGQLEDDGIEVVRTLYSSDASMLMDRYGPDLVAVDMTMRTLNGDRLVELAKAAKDDGIPFILVSSRPAVEVAELARLICATGVISRRTAVGRIAVPVRRWIPEGAELDIGPLLAAK